MTADTPLSLDNPAGRSLLIAGPPMTGKYELLFRILGGAASRGIVITTGDPAADVRASFVDAAGCDPSDVSVIDCVSKQRGEGVEDDETTRYVSSPKNVTEIGMKFTDLFERYRDDEELVAVGLHSLSELLVYLSPEEVYKFVRLITKQSESADWLTVATVNATMHDEQTLHTMYDPFDTVVDTRENDGARELRVRSGREPATAWTRF